MKLSIRKLDDSEVSKAILLVADVFAESADGYYTKDGKAKFISIINDPQFLASLSFYGAFYESTLTGVIATRCDGNHIALFFVREEYQNQKIGKALFKHACVDCKEGSLSVNAAPCAVNIYQALGFCETGEEQDENGIRFIPMSCDCRGVLCDMLTDTDNVLACAACSRLCELCRSDDGCYRYFVRFSQLLSHPKSLVRNRAIALLAASAALDCSDLFDDIIDRFISHIEDEKPITARQCVKALPEIAANKPHLAKKITAALMQEDISRYADSMRPLLKKDIAEALEKIGEA